MQNTYNWGTPLVHSLSSLKPLIFTLFSSGGYQYEIYMLAQLLPPGDYEAESSPHITPHIF